MEAWLRQKNAINKAWLIPFAAMVAVASILGGCQNRPDIESAVNMRPNSVSSNTASPDILVVGDSQISYGAGKAHLAFFENLPSKCQATSTQQSALGGLGSPSVAAIGVRSSSLHSWSLAGEKDKAMVCRADKKHGVNAGVYGFSGNKNRQYVQIGQGEEFQFCKAGATPFQAMFHQGYYAPKLLVIAFLGNSVKRWNAQPETAIADARRTMRQIPPRTPCVFMTTAPSYDEDNNQRREAAQTIIRTAFKRIGSRCSFVSGINADTMRDFTGNKAYFTTNQNGTVTDPNHPNALAASKFFEIMRPQLCKAVFAQLL